MNSSDIYSPDDLEAYLIDRGLSWESAHLQAKEQLKDHFTMRFPKYYADLIDWNNPEDPLKKLVLPNQQELQIQDYELADPIGDHTHEPVAGLVHRYPNRCLLLPTTHCTIHCRFCFRRDVIGKPLFFDIHAITAYLTQHQEIQEIIFTGGDPGTLPAGFLANMIDRISPIEHIRTWRFHTRTLVVNPAAVTDEWLFQLDRLNVQQKIIVLHVDHPNEVTPQLQQLVEKLQQHHILVLSQSVLLKAVNDSVETLLALFHKLSEIGIKPYYLHHLDKARGTHHFRLSIEEGKKLFTQLRGQISGYSIPEYVVDLPGGDGKVPVMWMQKKAPGTYEVINFEGRTITYLDPLGA